MKEKLDNFWAGLTAGFLLPLIVFSIFFSTATNTLSFGEFVSNMNAMGLSGRMFSSFAMPAFLLFYIAYQQRMDKAARGIVAASLIITFALVILYV